ncbi:MAG: phosphodiester glycosidase family protein [Caulobacteraceae bacterium]|nr:phosphodiester glycosidase family protein [Caulobacteraceae bacterium]
MASPSSLFERRRTLAALAAVLVLAGCATATVDAPASTGRGETLFAGGRYWREARTESGAMQIHVLELDLRRVRLELTAGDRSQGREHVAQTTSDYARRNGLAAAVNASYFTPFKGGSPGGEDFYPHAGDGADVSGAAIAFGREVSPVEPDADVRVNAIVCIRDHDVRILDGQSCDGPVDHAVSAGPRLLADGAPRDFAAFGERYGATRHPRTALGLDDDAPRAWLVVVDGRQPDWSEGASLPELIGIFQTLGAEQAINLDGGGSTTLVARRGEVVEVLNRPIHTGVPGRERPSANHIGVRVAP